MNGLIDFLKGKFVKIGQAPTVADANADNIITSASGKTPLAITHPTGSGVDAFYIIANGTGKRFQVDSNGTLHLLGALQLKQDAITPVADPGTAIPTARMMVNVASAATADRWVTLPAANAVGSGHTVIVIDSAGTAATETITVNAAGSDTINATAGTDIKTITAAYGALIFISNGVSKWFCYTLTPA